MNENKVYTNGVPTGAVLNCGDVIYNADGSIEIVDVKKTRVKFHDGTKQMGQLLNSVVNINSTSVNTNLKVTDPTIEVSFKVRGYNVITEKFIDKSFNELKSYIDIKIANVSKQLRVVQKMKPTFLINSSLVYIGGFKGVVYPYIGRPNFKALDLNDFITRSDLAHHANGTFAWLGPPFDEQHQLKLDPAQSIKLIYPMGVFFGFHESSMSHTESDNSGFTISNEPKENEFRVFVSSGPVTYGRNSGGRVTVMGFEMGFV